jgi:hypothetical protein
MAAFSPRSSFNPLEALVPFFNVYCIGGHAL